jgi:hypothetical protein
MFIFQQTALKCKHISKKRGFYTEERSPPFLYYIYLQAEHPAALDIQVTANSNPLINCLHTKNGYIYYLTSLLVS